MNSVGFARTGGRSTPVGRRPLIRRPPLAALLATGAALSALGLTTALAYRVRTFEQLDARAFNEFWMLQRRPLVSAEYRLVQSVNVVEFLLGFALLTAAGLLARRPRLIPAAVAVIAANLSTQVLKWMLPAHASTPHGLPIGTNGSYPSGHVTAAMSLVLFALAIAPRRARPLVAVVGLIYALLVGCTVMILATHYPSDVAAAYLTATFWALVALTLTTPAERRARPTDFSAAIACAWVTAAAVLAISLILVAGPRQTHPVAFGIMAVALVLTGGVCLGAVAALTSSPRRGELDG